MIIRRLYRACHCRPKRMFETAPAVETVDGDLNKGRSVHQQITSLCILLRVSTPLSFDSNPRLVQRFLFWTLLHQSPAPAHDAGVDTATEQRAEHRLGMHSVPQAIRRAHFRSGRGLPSAFSHRW